MENQTASKLEQFRHRYDGIADAYRQRALSPQALAAWQQEQLRVVLRHVKEKSPFYSRHLKDINPDAVTLESLHALPFTSKQDLRDQMHNMMSGPLSDAMYYYETTGTTGPATPCPRDARESYASNLQLRYAYEDMIAATFPAGHKPVMGILGPTEVHSFSDTLGSIAQDLGICHAKVWPGSPVIGFDKCIALLRDLKIDIVATSPGQVMTLAKEARRRGLDPLRDFSIKAFMLSGELCTEALASNLHSLWGARAFNSLYGSQEAFVIASTTPQNTLRPHLPNYIIEIVEPETGRYLGSTGHGELVVTCLVDGTKPLIRYRTGDIVTITQDSSKPLFDAFTIQVVGRVRDAVTLNGRAFTAAQIESALLSGVSGCFGYQIVITSNNGEDSIIAKMEIPDLTPEGRRQQIAVIHENMKNQLSCTATVMLVDDLSDHVNLGGWIKWKAARLVDTREQVQDADAELTPVQLLARLNKA